MKIVIARVAKGNAKWANQAVNEYLKRIERAWKVEEQKFKLSSKSSLSEKRAIESQQVQNMLIATDRLIVLDERGESVSSEQFAGWIESSMNEGCKRIVFAIGGPFGHAPELRKQAWKMLAFSPMVLNHEIARVLLAEQLYRAHTIISGGSYHH